MEISSLMALSPLDGRYAKQTEVLRDIFSEFALMRARVTVEIEWIIALSEFKLPELKELSAENKEYLRSLVSNFSLSDCEDIKKIEATTNHDESRRVLDQGQNGKERRTSSRQRIRSFRMHL